MYINNKYICSAAAGSTP